MITLSTSYKGTDVQGCHRHAMLRLAQDKTTCFVTKGALLFVGVMEATLRSFLFFLPVQASSWAVNATTS